ncbi:sulfatase-like hydrolase/transferase [Marinicella sediminis]|uniref:Sulfatase-like hydrolase/transferase n=1 Tax=Marinicella sediminis TaxID=1792834 RepID=A0ABV7JC36_9GAMM|nr:sulfatase [Marinicella sediminis]
MKTKWFMNLVFLAAFLIITGCDERSPEPTFNVLIVTFDTTRADHIGTYGKSDALTPNLDELASDGVVYERAVTHIPITLPSHSSMFTGKVPFTHGVRDNGLFSLGPEQLTLAEILKNTGYETGAAIGSFPLTSQFGIDQGFDYYNEHITQKYEDVHGERTIPKHQLFFDERPAGAVNEAIMPWIRYHHNKPFFAWLHYFDPHHPHEPPAPYDQSFIHDLYSGEIAYSDEAFGMLIDQLKQLGVYDNTLIVFTSDHGEGNGEHNEATHSLLIYNATQHVPLIIKYPNQEHAGTRIKQWVGLVDIFPTVLDVLGLEVPEDIQGQVLARADQPVDTNAEIYLETLSPRFSRGWGEQRGIIKNEHKYIHGPRQELYNLIDDPRELNNIIDQHQALANNLKSDLQDYLDEYQITGMNASINVDSQTLNTLRGLGYVQSSGDMVDVIEEKLSEAGDPPQDHVGTISIYSHAKNLLFQGEYIEANRYLQSLLNLEPDNLAYLELKIQADIQLGALESAKNHLKSLPNDLHGTLSPAKRLSLLGRIALAQGDHNSAQRLLADAENLEPSISGQLQLATIAEQNNQSELAQKHLERALSLEENNVEVLNTLAINHSKRGDWLAAEQYFSQAIEHHPYHQLTHYNYGVFLYEVADYESALKAFEQAIRLQDNYPKALFAIIETHMALGQPAKAHHWYDHFEMVNPNHTLFAKAQNLLETK